jgi:hypothetical protein
VRLDFRFCRPKLPTCSKSASPSCHTHNYHAHPTIHMQLIPSNYNLNTRPIPSTLCSVFSLAGQPASLMANFSLPASHRLNHLVNLTQQVPTTLPVHHLNARPTLSTPCSVFGSAGETPAPTRSLAPGTPPLRTQYPPLPTYLPCVLGLLLSMPWRY